MKHRISDFRRQTARRLRANETDAERKLWRALERIPLRDTHFRRQAPIGPYIVDFACLGGRLIIELDGGQHAEEDHARKDKARTAWLEKQGYRVIRFWNDDVMSDIESVLDSIFAAIHYSEYAFVATVSPPRTAARSDPPPQGEGG